MIRKLTIIMEKVAAKITVTVVSKSRSVSNSSM